MNPITRARKLGVCGLVFGTALAFAPYAHAQDEGAVKLLKTMLDYVTSQKNLSATYDSDIEVITSDLQKLQFTSSGFLVLSRPDKLRASRTGGYADVEFVYDGKTFTAHDRDNKAYAQTETGGSIEQLIDRLRNEFSVEAPGADLLLSSSFDRLMEDVTDIKRIGVGVINGVECEHLAFRGSETDWQIWIEIGSKPIPRKYIITNKGVAGAPQYTLRIRDWQTDAAAGAADAFTFKAPAGAKKVEFSALSQTDEVPQGTISGGKK